MGRVSAGRTDQERLRAGEEVETPGGKVEGPGVQGSGSPDGNKAPEGKTSSSRSVPKSYWTVSLIFLTALGSTLLSKF